MGHIQSVKPAGFSFQSPELYPVRLTDSQADMSDLESKMSISLSHVALDMPMTLDEALDRLLGMLASEDMPDLKAGTPRDMTVGKRPGRIVDISGTWRQVKGSGQAGVVNVDAKRLLLVIAFFGDKADGRQVLDAVLGSVSFFNPVTTACQVSLDPTYGYTITNPIQVGEGLPGADESSLLTSSLRGPVRERAYLDALRGPQGQTIQYSRRGSLHGKTAILDAYELTYPGLAKPIVLYLDMYYYGEPKAPVGLTCAYAFPLSAP